MRWTPWWHSKSTAPRSLPILRHGCPGPLRQISSHLRGCLKSFHGFLQRYPHAMVIVDFRELRTIVTSSEAALHQLKTLMSGLFKQPLRVLGMGGNGPDGGGLRQAARDRFPFCVTHGPTVKAGVYDA